MLFQRLYARVPRYGQLIHRSGVIPEGWHDCHKDYDSVMLKGVKRHPSHKTRIYLVLTECAIEDAEKRAEFYKDQVDSPIVFGYYTGKSSFKSVKSSGCIPKTCDLIFLRLFKFRGKESIKPITIALSERHFKRALDRARMHPDLVAKFHWWHWIYIGLYKTECWLRNLFSKKEKQ